MTSPTETVLTTEQMLLVMELAGWKYFPDGTSCPTLMRQYPGEELRHSDDHYDNAIDMFVRLTGKHNNTRAIHTLFKAFLEGKTGKINYEGET